MSVNYVNKELINAVKTIPVEQVVSLFYQDVAYNKKRSSSQFDFFENHSYIFLVNPAKNNVTIKEKDTTLVVTIVVL